MALCSYAVMRYAVRDASYVVYTALFFLFPFSFFFLFLFFLFFSSLDLYKRVFSMALWTDGLMDQPMDQKTENKAIFCTIFTSFPHPV